MLVIWSVHSFLSSSTPTRLLSSPTWTLTQPTSSQHVSLTVMQTLCTSLEYKCFLPWNFLIFVLFLIYCLFIIKQSDTVNFGGKFVYPTLLSSIKAARGQALCHGLLWYPFQHQAQYPVNSHLKEWLHCIAAVVMLTGCGSLNDRLIEEFTLCCLFSW